MTERNEVQIYGIDFVVRDGLVYEWGTARVYDPQARRGYMLDGDRRISLLSYGGFGSDRGNAEAAAAAWCDKAQAAWDAVGEHRVRLVWGEPYADERGDHCTLELVYGDYQVDTVDLADYPGAWDTEDPYSMAEADLMARNGVQGDVPVAAPWS